MSYCLFPRRNLSIILSVCFLLGSFSPPAYGMVKARKAIKNRVQARKPPQLPEGAIPPAQALKSQRRAAASQLLYAKTESQELAYQLKQAAKSKQFTKTELMGKRMTYKTRQDKLLESAGNALVGNKSAWQTFKETPGFMLETRRLGKDLEPFNKAVKRDLRRAERLAKRDPALKQQIKEARRTKGVSKAQLDDIEKEARKKVSSRGLALLDDVAKFEGTSAQRAQLLREKLKGFSKGEANNIKLLEATRGAQKGSEARRTFLGQYSKVWEQYDPIKDAGKIDIRTLTAGLSEVPVFQAGIRTTTGASTGKTSASAAAPSKAPLTKVQELPPRTEVAPNQAIPPGF